MRRPAKMVAGLPRSREGRIGGPVPCTMCNHQYTTISDSRASPRGTRRRRCCANCGNRFTTYELQVAPGSALEVLLKNGVTPKLGEIIAKAQAYDEIIAVARKAAAGVAEMTQMATALSHEPERKSSEDRDGATTRHMLSVQAEPISTPPPPTDGEVK